MSGHRKIQVLDPAKEERRVWEAKRAGANHPRTRRAEMMICEYCPTPISPDALLIDRGGRRACADCAKKTNEDLGIPTDYRDED